MYNYYNFSVQWVLQNEMKVIITSAPAKVIKLERWDAKNMAQKYVVMIKYVYAVAVIFL